MGNETATLTVVEYAALERVTRRTVYRWLRQGRVAGARRTEGGQWRLPDPRRAAPKPEVVVE